MICVVTGASGGLGRALAATLVAQGQRVVGLGRREAALQASKTLIGDGFEPMTCDIADPAAVAASFARIEAMAPISVLINNAAVYPRRDILDETPESFAATVAINLGGTVACTRAALTGMVARGEGRILNVATFADIAPLPASAAYSVSKGAQRIFSRALVADLGDRFPGIVISDWLPGMLATSMGLPGGLPPETAAVWGAELALWRDPTLNGTVWERDRELPPPRSLKRRVADRLLLRRPVSARRLGLTGD